jgi:hypothetical protein
MQEELEWHMETKDITKAGFQSYHILVRYYQAYKRLTKLVAEGYNHSGLKNIQNSLSIPGLNVEHQKNKCTEFFNIALELLKKHFEWWTKSDLLPAALMSELPLAKIVAHVIQRKKPQLKKPPNTTLHPFKSKAHNQTIAL